MPDHGGQPHQLITSGSSLVKTRSKIYITRRMETEDKLGGKHEQGSNNNQLSKPTGQPMTSAIICFCIYVCVITASTLVADNKPHLIHQKPR